MKKIRIPFSRIRNAPLRRSAMVLAYPLMVACNWLLIIWAAVKMILILPLVVLFQVLTAPFRLLGDDFTEAWHGRGPTTLVSNTTPIPATNRAASTPAVDGEKA